MSKHSALNPVALSMVICESASRDMLTSRFHLHGVLGEFEIAAVPVKLSFAVFATFTNLRESASFGIKVVDDEGEVLYTGKQATVEKADDPKHEADVLWIANVEFPRFGCFFVQLWSKNEYIIERCIWIQDVNEDAP